MTEMKEVCPGFELLAGWVEGTLSPRERHGVTAHLAACDDCRRAVEIASTAGPAPAREVDEALLARVVAGSRRRTPWRWAAAAGVAAAAGLGFWMASAPPAPAPLAVSPSVAPPPPPGEATPARVPTPEPPAKPEVAVAPEPRPPAEAPRAAERPLVPDPARETLVAEKPEEPPPPPPEPAPRREPGRTVVKEGYGPLFVIDPAGDLWVRREEGQAGRVSSAFEQVTWSDTFAARNAPSGFTVEGKASVVLDKGAEASVAYFKSEKAYEIILVQGLAIVDTEGAIQRWQVSYGRTQLAFANLRGRIGLEPRPGEQVAVVLLDGRADLRIGAKSQPAKVGREVCLGRDGQVTEHAAPLPRFAALPAFRPRFLTTFSATFEEPKDQPTPFPYGVTAGRVLGEGGSLFLRTLVPTADPKSGEKLTVEASLKPAHPFDWAAGTVLAFRYRSDYPIFTVHLGKFTAPFTSRNLGTWNEGELDLRTFRHEGGQMVPGDDKVEHVQFTAPADRKGGKLDIDGVQFLRRTR
jgi:hypothetical protein